MSTLYLVDASIYIFRAYFALPLDIEDHDGRPVNAVHGFVDFILRLIQETRARHIAVAFDGSLRGSFRNRLYPEYKANREAPPEELLHQFALCQSFVQALGIAHFIDQEYEADDLIGTLAYKMRRRDYKMVFVSEDKDLAQLMRPGDIFWRYARREKLDYQMIPGKYHVHAEQLADLLALCGDPVDNIPGVRGLGPKTAALLLAEFKTLGNILNSIEQLRTHAHHRVRAVYPLLKADPKRVQLARQLTCIAHDAPLRCAARALLRRRPDFSALNELLEQCDFSAGFAQRAFSLGVA